MTNVLHLRQKGNAQVIPHIRWEQYEKIDQAFDSVPGIRLAYLDGLLEIMTVGEEHEYVKSTIGLLLDAYLRSQQIRFYKRGGPTLGSRELQAIGEPDESYNIGTRKPFPDLVVEVVVTSGGVDKLEIYRRMGVAEVWFWEDGVLQINHLRQQADESVSHSELLPSLPIALFCRYITDHDQYDAVNEFMVALQQNGS